jgi:hypothetical protein
MRGQLQKTLALVLAAAFPFQDPRYAIFTDELMARLANGEPAGRSPSFMSE